MNDRACEHRVLDGLTVARCEPHSQPAAGVEVWMWSTETPQPQRCSCEVADRFYVVTDSSEGRWLECADVIVGAPATTVAEACGVAGRLRGRLRSCTLTAIPAGRCEMVFQAGSDTLVIGTEGSAWPVCEVCLYPWLSAGHNLAELL